MFIIYTRLWVEDKEYIYEVLAPKATIWPPGLGHEATTSPRAPNAAAAKHKNENPITAYFIFIPPLRSL
jgi:hypothetical protein